jgi:hypothetical protein
MLGLKMNRVDGCIMRQWLNAAAATAFFLGTIPLADARGSAGSVGFHAAGGRVSGKPAVAAKPAGMPERPTFRHSRQGWAFAASGIGYGLPGGDMADYDPALAVPPPEGFPAPPLLYPYGRPPQLTCIRPRLIMIGKVAPQAHLPRVVYGGPLPCGYKGS